MKTILTVCAAAQPSRPSVIVRRATERRLRIFAPRRTPPSAQPMIGITFFN